MENSQTQNWTLRRHENGIVHLGLDCVEGSTNVLSETVLAELTSILQELADQPDGIKGLLIFSAKKNGFLAGADVREFAQLENREQALQKIQYGQSVFNLLEQLPFSTAAAIHGFCLGGGLELALACNYRIAEDHRSCTLGLPEVRLGIHPGYGGTVRLPEIIGELPAIQVMLAGRTLESRQAKKIGLVDDIVPYRHLINASIAHLLANKPAPKRHVVNYLLRLKPLRHLASSFMHRQLNKKLREKHYPAPFALLKLWSQLPAQRELALRDEAHSVADLFTLPQTRQLVRLFLLRERLKDTGKTSDFRAQHVHVIGAGVMGGDIAAWCALHGCRVSLQDQNGARIAAAYKRAGELFAKKIKQSHELQEIRDRLLADPEGQGIRSADIVIEAIFEDLEAKQALLKEVEPQLKPDAILASNTSSIALEKLASILNRPERFLGLHFFNPVAKMHLVEVIDHPGVEQQCVLMACAFSKQIGKLPLVVKSSPGFLVNRILMPYLLEACKLVDEGVSAEYIDQQACDYGMPMGPLELADTVGLDICLSVAKVLNQAYQFDIPKGLQHLVQHKWLGKKSGRGFYEWKKGRPVRSQKILQMQSEDVQDRIILSLINEAVKCTDENLVQDTDLLDAGIVFGTGFAPFRGGPIQYLHDAGPEQLQKTLQALQQEYGSRFIPAEGWRRFMD